MFTGIFSLFGILLRQPAHLILAQASGNGNKHFLQFVIRIGTDIKSHTETVRRNVG